MAEEPDARGSSAATADLEHVPKQVPQVQAVLIRSAGRSEQHLCLRILPRVFSSLVEELLRYEPDRHHRRRPSQFPLPQCFDEGPGQNMVRAGQEIPVKGLPGLDFAGGFIFDGPWGRVVSATLTPDPSGMTDDDIAAIFAYLTTLTPVAPGHQRPERAVDAVPTLLAHTWLRRPELTTDFAMQEGNKAGTQYASSGLQTRRRDRV